MTRFRVFGVFAASVVILGAVNATFKCDEYSGNVECDVSACLGNPCGSGSVCCEDYSENCSYQCIDCPEYDVNANCEVDPCQENNCGPDESCCADYSEGCDYHCF